MKGKINLQTLRWLSEVTGKKKIYIPVLTVIQSFLGFSGVLYALFLRNIIDSAVSGDRTGFASGLAAILILVTVQILLRTVCRHTEELSRSTFENQIKSRLFRTLTEKSFEQVDSVHSAEWMNRLTNDSAVCANALTEIIPGLAGMAVKLAAAVIMILALEPKFGCILVPGGLLMLFLTWIFRKTLKKLHKNIQEKDGLLRIYLQDILGSLLVVRSFAAEEQAVFSADEKMNAHQAARMKRNRFSNICNTGFSGAMNAMYLFGVGYGSYGIMCGTLSYGTLSALLQLISQIQSPFANITGYLPKYFAMTASAERIMEAEKFENGRTESVMSSGEIHDFYRSSFRSLRFENVCFTYTPPVFGDNADQKMPVVLKDINLEISKGEYAAFTGHSGCGKSTLLKLLMCLYKPDEGKISIVSDIEEPLTSQWQRMFAYVPQGNHIMSGSVREIISFPEPSESMDDDRIKRALEIACADFVFSLENGIDTVLGEGGQGLSEGQIQRLAIARAVWSENPVLILDEATSSLDEKSEESVLNNLRSMTDRTVIIVTHRPAALNICDRIYSFDSSGHFILNQNQ